MMNKTKGNIKVKLQTKTMVIIHNMSRVLEVLQRVLRRSKVTVAMKLHTTLKQLLVQPKDKRVHQQTVTVVYLILC